ncbi:MAG TPA: hypothetical protein VHN16_18115 [Streptosporangiaceae bacterium]|nr:hypothetical protein [Streptosporangiaceae bacterium]
MRAVVMRAFGDPGVLEIEDVPAPSPQAGEALVRVAAVEVSRSRDVAARSGRHPFSRQITLPHVLGCDFAGLVHEVALEAASAVHDAVIKGTTVGHTVLRVSDSVA